MFPQSSAVEKSNQLCPSSNPRLPSTIMTRVSTKSTNLPTNKYSRTTTSPFNDPKKKKKKHFSKNHSFTHLRCKNLGSRPPFTKYPCAHRRSNRVLPSPTQSPHPITTHLISLTRKAAKTQWSHSTALLSSGSRT